MLVPPESSSAVLVMICSKSVSVCNHSHARLLDIAEIASYEGGTQIWCTRAEDSLNLGGLTMNHWNHRLMPNISCAGCLGKSPVILAQFTLEMCVAARNREKIIKTPILEFSVVHVHRCWYPRKARQQCLLWYAASLSICSRSHARGANSGEITTLRGTPAWYAGLTGVFSPSGTKFAPKKLETLRYHLVKTRSLCLSWAWIGTGLWQTDSRTDRITYRRPRCRVTTLFTVNHL